MNLFLAIQSFEKHTSNEGWQFQLSMESAGYKLIYANVHGNDIQDILLMYGNDIKNIIIQDPREWIGWSELNVPSERFTNYRLLANHNARKLCIIKDAQHFSVQNREFGEECGIDTWIHYYSKDIVTNLNPWLKSKKLIRTYHSVEASSIPLFKELGRLDRGLLSGAASSNYYPLRTRLFKSRINNVDCLKHPGYTATGTYTNQFLRTLNSYKVAICTASKYGYLLRKIIEASCCGCRVITNFSLSEVPPVIERNLTRVDDNIGKEAIESLVNVLCSTYDNEEQKEIAKQAIEFYRYEHIGQFVSNQIIKENE